MEPITTTALGTLILVKIAEGGATEAGKQVFEKIKGLLTTALREKLSQLLSLLRLKLPQTAEAIEKSPNPPLNIALAEDELKRTIQKDNELVKVVEEIDALVKADPILMQAVKEVIKDLKSQPSVSQNYTNIAEKIVNLAQGGGNIHIAQQTIN